MPCIDCGLHFNLVDRRFTSLRGAEKFPIKITVYMCPNGHYFSVAESNKYQKVNKPTVSYKKPKEEEKLTQDEIDIRAKMDKFDMSNFTKLERG